MKKLISILIATILGFGAYAFAAKKAPVPVNEKCPLSGKAINAEQTIGIGVCCGNCAEKVAKDLKGALGKLTADNKGGGDSEPVNTKCPISGKGSKKSVTVAFCCSKCKGKYAAK